MHVQKGRSRWDIIHELLGIIQEENKVKKTRIMQKAYLDWRNFKRYFDFLLEEGFVAKTNQDEYYELTEKGKELFRRLNEMKKLV
jgi:predicted transcriptional regulator